MNEIAFLEQLSPIDYKDFFDVDPRRDALIAQLKTRGFIVENILGGVKITPAGLSHLAALKKMDQDDLKDTAKDAPDNERKRREVRSERRHDWLIAIIGAVVSGLVLAAVIHLLGWTQ